MKLRFIFIFFSVLLWSKMANAEHLMGGEITWRALGGNDYEFTLVIYRDCNGLDIIDPSLNLRVWRHDVVSNITVNFISQTDLSPSCTPVFGGPAELDCGVGAGGGSGPGAVEKFVYRSNPITLAGSPPAEGWAFTYDSFSRNVDLDNIADPYAYGLTLSSIMYNVDDDCLDSSPAFAQDPYVLLCEGSDFQFNSNAFDPDNDSLVFSWGIPLDYFPSGDFNPPTNPSPVPFTPGYSHSNPTPDESFNPDNIPASMDPTSGQITFKSNTVGNFGFAQRIDCYRNGVLIATINRESQLIVIPCVGYDNNPPIIQPPFAGGTSFEAEFFAGDLISFDIEIEDLEVLQDGTPQTVTLIPTGNYFGSGLVDDGSGCDYTPCATLDTPPLIQGEQGVTTRFEWQTACDHLLDACGTQQNEQVYTFVLNAQDDYCSVPGRTYETIKITLKNKAPITPPNLNCVDVLDDGSVTLSWTPSVDTDGSFDRYEVHSLEDGFIADIFDVTTDSYTVVGAGADVVSKNYFLLAKFGCEGGSIASSDTLSSILMEYTNLMDGRISVKWNNTAVPANDGDDIMHGIYREFPIGTWTKRGEVPYGENLFIDTIDVCDAFLSYEIRIENEAGCVSTSNKIGDNLSDIINPIIPELSWVTVNPETEFVDVLWNVNPALDTYGYIIFIQDDLGFWIAKDTVWGRENTSWTNVDTEADLGSEGYRIAAFDSCFTATDPPTYQTSARSEAHRTIFLEQEYDLCAKSIQLEWSPYIGWIEEVRRYEVFASENGGAFELIGTIETAALNFNHTHLNYDSEYCYYVRAISVSDSISISNKVCQMAERPSQPAFHYLTTATHQLGGGIEVICYTDETAAVDLYEIEVKGPYDTDYTVIGTEDEPIGPFIYYLDENVFPERGEYQYRVNLIDTCGRVGKVSNIGKPSFLKVTTDHVRMIHTLDWSSYADFNGDIQSYNIFRGENGVFDANPIATTLPGVRSYVDDVSEYYNSQGQFCYRIEAVETENEFGFNESSFSNTACAVIDPLVYIPNAFMINGENSIFLPVLSRYDFDSYQLNIYNRWGENIFQTLDRFEGWNGYNEKDNEFYEEGIYIYHLTFKDREGNDYEYRGTVALLIGG